MRIDLEKALLDWGGDEDEDDGEDAPANKGLPEKKRKKLLDAKTWERDGTLVANATKLREELGGDRFDDHNVFREAVTAAVKSLNLKGSAADWKLFHRAVSWRVETAPPVVAKVHKPAKATADPLHGRYDATVGGKKAVVEYEPDPDLRDTEQVPLQEEVEAFLRREVLPYTPDAWIDAAATKIGYEISFTQHFYKPQPLRPLDAIRADILALEKETENLLGAIIGGTAR